MFKFLQSGGFRRVRSLSLPRHWMEVKKTGALVRPFTLYSATKNLHITHAHKFSFRSRRNTMSHHALTAWKRLSQTSSYSGPATSMFACAMGFALIKFHPVSPAIYSLFGRELPSLQRVWAGEHVECPPLGNIVYRRTQLRHSYLTSIMVSMREQFFVVMRAIHLAILFSPTIAMAPFLDLFGTQFRKIWIDLFCVTLEKAGPAFITWGQWAATRPDLFPRDLCIELSNLNYKTREHNFAYTKQTIEKAFGRNLSEIFDDFDEAPIELGNVAQVHRATLRSRYPGKQVKPIIVDVKVRHPDIIDSFGIDLVVIQSLSNVANHIPSLKWLRLNERIHQFEDFISSQVDLSKQAMILSRFSYNFRGWKDVSYPKPLYPLVHPAVFVKTYEKGKSVSHYIDHDCEIGMRTKDNVVNAGTRALMTMLMADKLIHTSMNPENIIVREINGKGRIVIRDVGITAEYLSTGNIPRLVRACGTRNGRVAAECTLKLSKKQNCPCPDAFIEDVEQSFDFWDTKEGGIITPLECMHRLLEKCRCHKVNIDDDACTAMVSIMNVEAWQRKLYLESLYRVMQTFHCQVVSTSFPAHGTQWRSERGRRTINVLD